MSVGRDISTYLKPLYDVCKSAISIPNCISTCKSVYGLRDVETGFILLVFFTTKISHSINFVFFIIETLIIVPTYISIEMFTSECKSRGLKFSDSMAVFVFCGLFYCYYLSAMRQGIACSLVLLAIICWISEKKKVSIPCILIASTMHHSGIFGFALILVYILCYKKHSKWTNVLLFSGIVFALAYNKIFPVIMSVLQRFGLMSNKYIGWSNNAYYSADTVHGINWAGLICTVYALAVAYLVFRRRKNDITIYLLVASFLSICLTPFIARYPTFGRINVYFLELCIFTLPLLYESLYKISKRERNTFVNMLNTVFIVGYWFVTIVIAASYDTAIYKFFWQ